MSDFSELRDLCNVIICNGLTGSYYRVEVLKKDPHHYGRAFRLSLLGHWPVGYTCHCHQVFCGLQQCDCGSWTEAKGECEHTRLLIAAGFFDEPPAPEAYQGGLAFPEDDLADIDWESEAP